jgi:hypothetical protein
VRTDYLLRPLKGDHFAVILSATREEAEARAWEYAKVNGVEWRARRMARLKARGGRGRHE